MISFPLIFVLISEYSLSIYFSISSLCLTYTITGSACKYFYIGSKPVSDQVSWVSTGGGSSLVLMEGKELPAVTYLSNIGEVWKPTPPDESKEPVDDDED
jgi:hypothetical protein